VSVRCKTRVDIAPRFKVYSRGMTSYSISDAARQTGLPTSTLRYYERIGLLPAPGRTDSGYRAYEERALERLAFIAHARALGLRLDEIGELADLWDADRCGPVQERLRALITAKIADTQARANALMELSSELSSFVGSLKTSAPDAPCGADCGCHTGPGPAGSSARSLAMLPSTGPDLACSLEGDDMTRRLAEWRVLAGQATARLALDDGIRLTFSSVDLRMMADLVAREQACCSFLSFAIASTPVGATLDISGPSDVRPMIAALLDVPT
jgi:DNA-binding transcriptional MerR regulator